MTLIFFKDLNFNWRNIKEVIWKHRLESKLLIGKFLEFFSNHLNQFLFVFCIHFLIVPYKPVSFVELIVAFKELYK